MNLRWIFHMILVLNIMRSSILLLDWASRRMELWWFDCTWLCIFRSGHKEWRRSTVVTFAPEGFFESEPCINGLLTFSVSLIYDNKRSHVLCFQVHFEALKLSLSLYNLCCCELQQICTWSWSSHQRLESHSLVQLLRQYNQFVYMVHCCLKSLG